MGRSGGGLSGGVPCASRRDGQGSAQSPPTGGPLEASAAKPSDEQQLEGQILIRQITHHQPTWTERERGAPGSFTVQLILDHGADQYVIHPAAEDAEVLTSLLTKAEESGTEVWFDLGRKVVMFGNRAVT